MSMAFRIAIFFTWMAFIPQLAHAQIGTNLSSESIGAQLEQYKAAIQNYRLAGFHPACPGGAPYSYACKKISAVFCLETPSFKTAKDSKDPLSECSYEDVQQNQIVPPDQVVPHWSMAECGFAGGTGRLDCRYIHLYTDKQSENAVRDRIRADRAFFPEQGWKYEDWYIMGMNWGADHPWTPPKQEPPKVEPPKPQPPPPPSCLQKDTNNCSEFVPCAGEIAQFKLKATCKCSLEQCQAAYTKMARAVPAIGSVSAEAAFKSNQFGERAARLKNAIDALEKAPGVDQHKFETCFYTWVTILQRKQKSQSTMRPQDLIDPTAACDKANKVRGLYGFLDSVSSNQRVDELKMQSVAGQVKDLSFVADAYLNSRWNDECLMKGLGANGAKAQIHEFNEALAEMMKPKSRVASLYDVMKHYDQSNDSCSGRTFDDGSTDQASLVCSALIVNRNAPSSTEYLTGQLSNDSCLIGPAQGQSPNQYLAQFRTDVAEAQRLTNKLAGCKPHDEPKMGDGCNDGKKAKNGECIKQRQYPPMDPTDQGHKDSGRHF